MQYKQHDIIPKFWKSAKRFVLVMFWSLIYISCVLTFQGILFVGKLPFDLLDCKHHFFVSALYVHIWWKYIEWSIVCSMLFFNPVGSRNSLKPEKKNFSNNFCMNKSLHAFGHFAWSVQDAHTSSLTIFIPVSGHSIWSLWLKQYYIADLIRDLILVCRNGYLLPLWNLSIWSL